MPSNFLRRALIFLIGGLLAQPAFAQSGPYVLAGAEANVFRRDHSFYDGGLAPFGSGEVLAGVLRLGAPLGDRWGVEVEFARSGELESDSGFAQHILTGPLPLGGTSGTVMTWTSGDAASLLIFPPQYSVEAERTHTSINTAVWWQQTLGERVALAYLGGISFFREAHEMSTAISPLLRIQAPIRLASQYRSVNYGTAPLAGFEARIRLTESVRLVPGLRLQGLDDGWLVRAGIGLGWWF